MMLDRGSVKKVVSGVLSEIAANIGHDFFLPTLGQEVVSSKLVVSVLALFWWSRG